MSGGRPAPPYAYTCTIDHPTRGTTTRRGAIGPSARAPRPPAEGGPSYAEVLANARACPHREPIPAEAPAECGCRHRCAAGLGTRTGGGVIPADCWECPLAPRRSPGWPTA
jgi:hypothetical protein